MKFVRKVDGKWKTFNGDRTPLQVEEPVTYIYLNWDDLVEHFKVMAPGRTITQFALEDGGIEMRLELEDKEE